MDEQRYVSIELNNGLTVGTLLDFLVELPRDAHGWDVFLAEKEPVKYINVDRGDESFIGAVSFTSDPVYDVAE